MFFRTEIAITVLSSILSSCLHRSAGLELSSHAPNPEFSKSFFSKPPPQLLSTFPKIIVGTVLHHVARCFQKFSCSFREMRPRKPRFPHKMRFSIAFWRLRRTDEWGAPTLIELPQRIIGIWGIKNCRKWSCDSVKA